ncbi:MAG TPA: class I SAM-dependent methyltransferase [Bacillota bacterium]|nr:class I SAM-dependent methyltransferase [Bacillota bacterium]
MLKDTGERVILEKMKRTNPLLIEHLARYHFACEYAYGRVLDFASGTGYGSHIIAKTCKKKVTEVIGVDVDANAVQYARSTYFHPRSSFLQKDVTDESLPDQLGAFDVIVSFETFEHIEEEEQYMSNIYQLLKKGGTLILSTPFGKGRGIPSGNRFHVHQLTVVEFKELFSDYSDVEFYFQKGALIVPENFATKKYFPLGIAVCRK